MITNRNKLFALFFLLLSFEAWTADYLMYLGAGGEPDTSDGTMFDKTIGKIGTYVKSNPGIKVDIAFNGGHYLTEQLIEETFPEVESKSHFLESDYKRLIASYKLKLEKNEIKSGDQFMIFIDSHGAPKSNKYKTHSVATSSGQGASTVDIDQLEVLKNLAFNKGVKMAIIDNSCHSGNTLALADDNTCIISSTGPNHFGYGPFSERFSGAMGKGKNLEEIFLSARLNDRTPALPMISTKAGLEVNSSIYETITPFLYNFEPDQDKLSEWLEENSSEEKQCASNKNFNSLFETINRIESLNASTNKILGSANPPQSNDLSRLKILLQEYKKSLDLVKNEVRQLDSKRLATKESFQGQAKVGIFRVSVVQEYSWKELLEMDFDFLIQNVQDGMKGETDKSSLAEYKAMTSLYTLASAKKDELLAKHPDLLTIESKMEDVKKLIKSNYGTSLAIAKEERKLYSILYNKAHQNLSFAQPNPCKDFKL